jgi:hypothetical protein
MVCYPSFVVWSHPLLLSKIQIAKPKRYLKFSCATFLSSFHMQTLSVLILRYLLNRSKRIHFSYFENKREKFISLKKINHM